MKRMNRLNRLAARKLEDAILARKDDIESGDMTKANLTLAATSAAGVPLTWHNIEGAAETVGVSLSAYHKRKGANNRGASVLNKRIKIVASALCQLAEQLGEPLPKELCDIANDLDTEQRKDDSA